eukprot:TRINITY_DN10985_c0_g1_i1.p2 TRINITY_DN10985_c0_g1~~TRINITY_DN10985_c0_g1_i1.p2  ORF type:complete len:181 (+),score=41.27 TRINITY_DN10985_c0_g1_i1:87-629(+)
MASATRAQPRRAADARAAVRATALSLGIAMQMSERAADSDSSDSEDAGPGLGACWTGYGAHCQQLEDHTAERAGGAPRPAAVSGPRRCVNWVWGFMLWALSWVPTSAVVVGTVVFLCIGYPITSVLSWLWWVCPALMVILLLPSSIVSAYLGAHRVVALLLGSFLFCHLCYLWQQHASAF